MSAHREVRVCGIPIHDFPDSNAAIVSMEETAFRSGDRPPLQVNFVNAHVVNTAMAVPEFRAVLERGEMNLADGVGIWLGGRMHAAADLANLNGTDFGVEVLKWGAETNRGFFFLGARSGVAELARKKLEARIPRLRVLGCHNGYLDESSSEEAIRMIVASGAEIVFVCMGVPAQELWIDKHRTELAGVKLILGLGAFFDFYAEVVARSPLWMRRMRIEWVYRFLQEPRRLWKRYIIGNLLFFVHLVVHRRGIVGGTKT